MSPILTRDRRAHARSFDERVNDAVQLPIVTLSGAYLSVMSAVRSTSFSPPVPASSLSLAASALVLRCALPQRLPSTRRPRSSLTFDDPS